jgi:hypothetical protein
MLFLSADVINHTLHIGLRNGKHAISSLPMETPQFCGLFLNPTGGNPLGLLHNIRHTPCPGEQTQNVDMVLNTTNLHMRSYSPSVRG